MKRTPELKTPKAHGLYVVRRRQRNAALKKVIRFRTDHVRGRIVDCSRTWFTRCIQSDGSSRPDSFGGSSVFWSVHEIKAWEAKQAGEVQR